MITALKNLLSRRRPLTPPPARSDLELHGLALEALDRLIEAWRARPAEIDGADAAPIILDICAREGLSEDEFHGVADHFTVVAAEFTDRSWAAHLRDAIPVGRA